MKRFVLFIMAILLIGGLVACGNKENDIKPAPVPSSDEGKTENKVDEVVQKGLTDAGEENGEFKKVSNKPYVSEILKARGVKVIDCFLNNWINY